MPLRKIVSGGQTGADQAGLRAAKSLGLETGGWMPYGFNTEEGYRPEFAAWYGISETSGDRRYSTRTRRNVRDSDATVWFGQPASLGYEATRKAVLHLAKPLLHVEGPTDAIEAAAASVVDFVRATKCEILNVAGNRESNCPGVGAFTETVLMRALTLLKHVGTR